MTGIFLLSLYLFSFVELHNLLKVPVLIEHFREHRQEDPSLSFFSFIKLHYMDPLVADDDYQRDQQLPFRDSGCCLLTASSASECLSFSLELLPPPSPLREYARVTEADELCLAQFDIFQPPRCA